MPLRPLKILRGHTWLLEGFVDKVSGFGVQSSACPHGASAAGTRDLAGHSHPLEECRPTSALAVLRGKHRGLFIQVRLWSTLLKRQ